MRLEQLLSRCRWLCRAADWHVASTVHVDVCRQKRTNTPPLTHMSKFSDVTACLTYDFSAPCVTYAHTRPKIYIVEISQYNRVVMFQKTDR
jgi:hypothetical protein